MQSSHGQPGGRAQGVLESKGALPAQCARGGSTCWLGWEGHVVWAAPGWVLLVTGRVLVFTPHLAQPPRRTSKGFSLQLRLQEGLKVQHLLTAPQSRAAGPLLKGALSLHGSLVPMSWRRQRPR